MKDKRLRYKTMQQNYIREASPQDVHSYIKEENQKNTLQRKYKKASA